MFTTSWPRICIQTMQGVFTSNSSYMFMKCFHHRLSLYVYEDDAKRVHHPLALHVHVSDVRGVHHQLSLNAMKEAGDERGISHRQPLHVHVFTTNWSYMHERAGDVSDVNPIALACAWRQCKRCSPPKSLHVHAGIARGVHHQLSLYIYAGNARGVHHQLPWYVPEKTQSCWRDVKIPELTHVRVCKRCKRCSHPTILACDARGVHHQLPLYVPKVTQCGWRNVTMQELTLYVHTSCAKGVHYQLT